MCLVSRTARSGLARTLFLNRRARHRAIRAEHAAIALPGTQRGAAADTFVEELAGISRHGFRFGGSAMRAGHNAFKDHGASSARRRGTPSEYSFQLSVRSSSAMTTPHPRQVLGSAFESRSTLYALSDQRTPLRVPKAPRDKILTRRGEKGTQTPCAVESAQQRSVPLASLRSARVAAGFRLSFEVAAVEFRQFRPAA